MASVTYGKCIMANVIMAKIFMAKILWQMKLSLIKFAKYERKDSHFFAKCFVSWKPYFQPAFVFIKVWAFQGNFARKVISEVYAFLVLQCTFFWAEK